MHSLFAIAFLLLNTQYASFTERPIKALSDSDIRQLHEGHGMGLALAAELNHYPGPKHVLEMADVLNLTSDQKSAIQQVHDEMKAAAVETGRQIIVLERQLDQAFASAEIDAEQLDRMTAAIAGLQGKLRYTHLAAHLTTRAILTPHQISSYDEKRGYGAGHEHRRQH